MSFSRQMLIDSWLRSQVGADAVLYHSEARERQFAATRFSTARRHEWV